MRNRLAPAAWPDARGVSARRSQRGSGRSALDFHGGPRPVDEILDQVDAEHVARGQRVHGASHKRLFKARHQSSAGGSIWSQFQQLGAVQQKILAIRVTASAPARFDGAQLLAALRAEGLGFGRYEIFHCLHEDGRPIYSVASLREPGTFDIEAMPTTYFPGVAMFAVLPGPVPAAEAFDEMIFSARALATHLSGSLTDERGAPLTTLRVGKLREEALEFERGAGPA